MSEFKGTPPPWKVLNARKENWIGRPLDYWTVTAEGHDKWLCASPEWDPEHDEESAANARLIAAAPELLEALQAAIASFDEWAEGVDPCSLADAKERLPWVDQARAAISLALGE